MPRLRLYDVRLSRLPTVIGRCAGDIAAIANYVNSAQRRLLLCREASDEGWYGTFAEVMFTNVSRTLPWITLSREMARIEALGVCSVPVPVHNQFVEYLEFGNGRMPKNALGDNNWCLPNGYRRNNAITFSALPFAAQKIRIYSTSVSDAASGYRVFIQGVDHNGSVVYTVDNFNNVKGEFVTLRSPFADTDFLYSGSLTGIQKDVTIGQLQFFAVNVTTGEEVLIHTMEPSETVAGYTRYFLNNLPYGCCNPSTTTPQALQVKAIVKLEIVPVSVDTDYLLFHNLEAIIEECASLRYSEMDNANAKQMAHERHIQAVRLLNGELTHYYGTQTPAISFNPFGSAKLERMAIGTQI